MKKFSLFIAALALVFVTSQCSKEDKPLQNGEKQHIVLTANNGNDGSKVAGQFLSDELDLKWENGDVINVGGGATGILSLLEGAGTKSATFEGDIEKVSEAPITFTVGTQPDYLNQTGADSFITDNICLVGFSGYHEDGNYTVDMELPYAVLKLDLSYFGSDAKAGVDVKIKVQDDTIAKVTGVTSASKEMFVAIPADNTEKTYVFNDNVEKTWTLAPNVFYTKSGSETGEAIVIEPATPTPTYVFSVSADKTVTFAPGNLYWDGSAFKFEENQWTYQDSWVSSHVGYFFWSSDAAVACAETYNDPAATTGYDEVFFTEQPGFTVNGETDWHTLSADEWDYLLGFSKGAQTYTDSNVRPNALALRTNKTVGEVSGYVILPDGTENPDVVFSNIVNLADLATYNAVFIPDAGYRMETEGVQTDDFIYWTSTPGPISMVESWPGAYYMGSTDGGYQPMGVYPMFRKLIMSQFGSNSALGTPLRLAKYNN